MKPGLSGQFFGIPALATAAIVISVGMGTRLHSFPRSASLYSSTAQQSTDQQQPSSDREQSSQAKPAPGTAPVAGDIPPIGQDTLDVQKAPKGSNDRQGKGAESSKNVEVDPHNVIEVGSKKITVNPGGIDDVSAVGLRNIGGRGMGNWYSTESEIKMGKQYAVEIEKSTRFITDPVVTEYVNRIGQNIVKNSDCKVPFTIKVIDSDEINAMALPGGFFYVNSGLVLSTDEEAELAGVMAHETAHVCAHHAARQMTRMNYTQLGMIPVMMMGYGWTAFGIYEAAQFVVPVAFLKFSRDFEREADYLGIQYAYRAGYDPQATITFFEKIQALQKRKPGVVSKAFSDHPQTPDRIVRSQEEIASILPARDQYTVSTSEFDDVKSRLARIQNKRRLIDSGEKSKPSLRRASTGNDSSAQETYSREDRPTLQRREEQED